MNTNHDRTPDAPSPALETARAVGKALGLDDDKADARLAADLDDSRRQRELIIALGEVNIALIHEEHDFRCAAIYAEKYPGRLLDSIRQRSAKCAALRVSVRRAVDMLDQFIAFAKARDYDLRTELLACLIDWQADACPKCGCILESERNAEDHDNGEVSLPGRVCRADGCGYDDRQRVSEDKAKQWAAEQAANAE